MIRTHEQKTEDNAHRLRHERRHETRLWEHARREYELARQGVNAHEHMEIVGQVERDLAERAEELANARQQEYLSEQQELFSEYHDESRVCRDLRRHNRTLQEEQLQGE